MDPNLLRNIEYFSGPNNQTLNPLDQGSGAGTSPQTGQSSIWDNSLLAFDGALTGSPSTAPESFAFPTPGSSTSFGRQSSLYSPQSRPVLQPRRPRGKDGRERKRSKLSADSTPFDNVDYWLQFDNSNHNEDSIAEDTELDSTKREGKKKSRDAANRRQVSRSEEPSSALKSDDVFDDTALDNALSEEGDDFSSMNLAEQLSKIDSMPPSEIPAREGLYSTPLSWERPQMGLRYDQLWGMQTPTLGADEQRRLIAIAMNSGAATGGYAPSYVPNYGFDTLFGSGYGTTSLDQLSVFPPDLRQTPRPTAKVGLPKEREKDKHRGKDREKEKEKAKEKENEKVKEIEKEKEKEKEKEIEKEKKTEKGKGKGKDKDKEEEEEEDVEEEHDKNKDKSKPGGDRAAHNDIERKYRTNLKDRIAELRDAIPALRTAVAEGEEEEDENQPPQAPKVSKGVILTKATEYIQYLERRNKAITQQHRDLSRRIQAFEQLLSASARPTFQMPTYSRTLFDPRAFC